MKKNAVERTMTPWNNLVDLLKYVEVNINNPTHLNDFKAGKWHSYSTAEAISEIRYLALGLVSLGIQRGECIGLYAQPSRRWWIVNFAAIMAGAVIVPIFPNISEENFVFEIQQTQIKTIFVSEGETSGYFDNHRDLFKNIINLNGSTSKNTFSYNHLLENGQGLELEQSDFYARLQSLIQDHDLAAIIYTSGTTGVPKGAEHTHHSLARHLSDQPIDISPPQTKYLNILPLAHIFGYTINLIVFGFGGSIYYWNDPKQFGLACRELHPTLLVVVPRLLERVYAKILSAIQQTGFVSRTVGLWAFKLANDEEPSMYHTLMHPIADHLVYHALRENLGGNIQLIVSGGAALDPHLNHFYKEIGVPICEGWGMTEACPVCVNLLDSTKIGTVGPPIGNLELKLSEENEILVKGTAVMRGYFKSPEETAKAIDKDGWLHTGDRGAIDNEGFLSIKGRIKEMFKTSTGEYVVPIPIEQALCRAPLVEAAMVIADGRKFTSCLLFANKEVLDGLKKMHHQEKVSDEEFLHSYLIQEETASLLEQINKPLNNWEKIQDYRWIAHAPTIEADEITPSMKLRREVIMKNYKHLIDSMYQEVLHK